MATYIVNAVCLTFALVVPKGQSWVIDFPLSVWSKDRRSFICESVTYLATTEVSAYGVQAEELRINNRIKMCIYHQSLAHLFQAGNIWRLATWSRREINCDQWGLYLHIRNRRTYHRRTRYMPCFQSNHFLQKALGTLFSLICCGQWNPVNGQVNNKSWPNGIMLLRLHLLNAIRSENESEPVHTVICW